MFGILRTLLALMVMIYHLFLPLLPLGIYSVFGFYIISGYLMTLVMHKTYGYSVSGRLSFASNRFLRLYPLYWVAAGLTIILILYLGSESVSKFHKSMVLPQGLREFFSNFFMVFSAWKPINVEPRLVPPSWALTVELFFYLLICLGLSKTFSRVKIWFTVSIIYFIVTYVLGLTWHDRYFPVMAASLPFSIGACLFFLSSHSTACHLIRRVGLSSLWLLILWLLNCAVWMALSYLNVGVWVEIGFCLNLVFCALLIFKVVSGDEILPISRKWDRWIGDFSYPIYLFHWQSGLIVSYILFGEPFHDTSLRGLGLLFGFFIFYFLPFFGVDIFY